MSFDSIPEDREESYPCECGGNITRPVMILEGEQDWQCDSCGREFIDKE